MMGTFRGRVDEEKGGREGRHAGRVAVDAPWRARREIGRGRMDAIVEILRSMTFFEFVDMQSETLEQVRCLSKLGL